MKTLNRSAAYAHPPNRRILADTPALLNRERKWHRSDRYRVNGIEQYPRQSGERWLQTISREVRRMFALKARKVQTNAASRVGKKQTRAVPKVGSAPARSTAVTAA